MAAKTSDSAAVLVITILLGALFIYVGYVTLEYDIARQDFVRWHYPDWLRLVVGALEIAGGALLFYPRTTWIGALTLAALMSAAAATLWLQEGLYPASVPGLLLISLSSLAYHRFPRKVSPPAPAPH